MTEEQIKLCIDKLVPVINSEGAAGVIWAIKDALQIDKSKVEDHMIEKITATITDSGYYTMRERNNDYYIFKNPNRFLNQNLIETNKSLQTVNNITIPKSANIQKNHGRWSLGLAGLSVIFIGITAYLQGRDKTAEEVQQLRIQVQRSLPQIDSIEISLKEINSSIRSITTDAILVKQKK